MQSRNKLNYPPDTTLSSQYVPVVLPLWYTVLLCNCTCCAGNFLCQSVRDLMLQLLRPRSHRTYAKSLYFLPPLCWARERSTGDKFLTPCGKKGKLVTLSHYYFFYHYSAHNKQYTTQAKPHVGASKCLNQAIFCRLYKTHTHTHTILPPTYLWHFCWTQFFWPEPELSFFYSICTQVPHALRVIN